jgi:GntR family transcriptional repressor for pyruvate dehydrogenase complex
MNILGLEFRKTASETAEVIRGSIRDHKRIVEALRSADPESARQAMREHMQHVLRTTPKPERQREAG